jgi:exosortase
MDGSISVGVVQGKAVRTVGESFERSRIRWGAIIAVCVGLIVAAYWHSFKDIFYGSLGSDSLYSHALFIPVICLFFVWRQRSLLGRVPLVPSPLLGYPLLLAGCFMLLLGDFLGFMTFVHMSLLPVVFGLCFLMLGRPATVLIWFPLAFLFFMLPMPYSLISVISFKSKMLATESAVQLGQLLTLNLVQDGSWVYLGSNDRLLVGDVCGGMRSLIALLAFGALMAYISKTRGWARIVILLISPAVAIAANVARILFLCVVGYFWGSEAATGIVHDVSGIGIFAFAFLLLFGAEGLLRKFAPAHETEENRS